MDIIDTMLGKIKYGLSEIARKGDNPYWWQQRFASRVAGPMLSEVYNNPGEDFMNLDWDNLLILDACRADMFEEAFDTDSFDEYRRVHSIGCSSPEWIRESFAGKEYPDTVYVTANPWVSKIAADSFCEIINLWIENYPISEADLQDAIDLSEVDGVDIDDSPTIYADELSDAARKTQERYPNKRLIIHYFQPHAPVVGNPDGSRRNEVLRELNPGGALRNGEVSREEVWEAYLDNLKYVFTHAEQLADDLEGRSAFSADHGELFGDRIWPIPMRAYEHPSGLRHPKLTQVPWAIKEVGPRRTITEGDISHHESDTEEINTRLKQLGYKV